MNTLPTDETVNHHRYVRDQAIKSAKRAKKKLEKRERRGGLCGGSSTVMELVVEYQTSLAVAIANDFLVQTSGLDKDELTVNVAYLESFGLKNVRERDVTTALEGIQNVETLISEQNGREPMFTFQHSLGDKLVRDMPDDVNIGWFRIGFACVFEEDVQAA